MTAKKILIIDDDAELCDELSDIVAGEDYLVETVTDSARGLALIKKNIYNLVILDFKMPNLTAVDILKEVKEKNIKTKFIIVSGRPFLEAAIKKENLLDMVSAIISKPFNPETLLQIIANSI